MAFDPITRVLDRFVARRVSREDATRRESQGPRLRTSGKWISTVTRVCFNMLEYIVHVLRLYKACDASKIVATQLCGSSFLLRLRVRAFDYVRLVLCNEPAGMGL